MLELLKHYFFCKHDRQDSQLEQQTEPNYNYQLDTIISNELTCYKCPPGSRIAHPTNSRRARPGGGQPLPIVTFVTGRGVLWRQRV